MKRIILGVTGIRSEYDIMSSVFRAIDNSLSLDLKLVVTGAHLSDAYGHTIDEIRSDGFEVIDEIQNLLNGDKDLFRVKVLRFSCKG